MDRWPPAPTGGWRYLRFHGQRALYAGMYGRKALEPVAADLQRWGGDAYVYFNNDRHGHALVDALDLLDLVGQGVPRPSTLEAVARS